MGLIIKSDLDYIKQKLDEKFKNSECPMCKNNNFTITDGYINNLLSSDFNNITLDGPSIPAISVICTNCGFISQHSLGVLGIVLKEGKGDNIDE